MNKLGLYLRLLRLAKGVTLETISDAIGVSDRGIRSWEKDGHIPGVLKLQKLVEYLGGSWNSVETILRSDIPDSTIEEMVQRDLRKTTHHHELHCLVDTLEEDQAIALATMIRAMRQNVRV